MSGVHRSKIQFNPQVEYHVGTLIRERADAAFAGSGSACVTAIIEWWLRQGAPPLNDAEKGLLAIGKLATNGPASEGPLVSGRAQKGHG